MLVLASSVLGQDLHLLGPNSWTKHPVSPATMNDRIERAASEYRQHAPIPRVALFDIAYPADEDEYKALDGYAVMLVTVLSQTVDELPPRRVFVKVGEETSNLTLIASVFSNADPAQLTAAVFGTNRWEGLYLFPVYLKGVAQELLTDFARNREGFVLTRFREQDLQDFPFTVTKPKAGKPNPGALATIISREFPGFIVK